MKMYADQQWEQVLFVTFQVEELVDKGNVYPGDVWRFCCYRLLWSTCFNPAGKFKSTVQLVLSFKVGSHCFVKQSLAAAMCSGNKTTFAYSKEM